MPVIAITSVNTTTEEITAVAHGLVTGDRFRLRSARANGRWTRCGSGQRASEWTMDQVRQWAAREQQTADAANARASADRTSSSDGTARYDVTMFGPDGLTTDVLAE